MEGGFYLWKDNPSYIVYFHSPPLFGWNDVSYLYIRGGVAFMQRINVRWDLKELQKPNVDFVVDFPD